MARLNDERKACNGQPQKTLHATQLTHIVKTILKVEFVMSDLFLETEKCSQSKEKKTEFPAYTKDKLYVPDCDRPFLTR